jgi:hypothetical protein
MKTFVLLFTTATRKWYCSGWCGNFMGYYITTDDFEVFSKPARIINSHPDLWEVNNPAQSAGVGVRRVENPERASGLHVHQQDERPSIEKSTREAW